jgi:tetratricopeptide (TPR) repeat protein
MEAAGDEPLEGAGEGSMEAAGDEPAAKAEPTADPGDDEEAGHAAAGTPPHPSAIDMNAERRDPAQSDRLVIQARRAILRDKLDEAASHLERALALDPRNPRAYAGYGHFFVAQGDGRTALPWIEKAVSARPRRAPYHILLGDAKKLLGDEEGARAAWQKALRLDRDSREARERLF